MASRLARAPGWLDESLREQPIRFVDVGARGGWQRKWSAHSDWVSFVGFEPDLPECERLQARARPNETFVPRGLHRAPGRVNLYHCRRAAWTSIYPPDEEVFARLFGDLGGPVVTRVDEIEVTTFDRAMEDVGGGAVDFVKLDTQGSELDILMGAERALAGPMVGIELEVEFIPLYRGQPLFPDVDRFLRDRGWDFMEFPTSYSRSWMAFGNRAMRGYRGLGDFVANWAGLLRAPGGAWRGGQQVVYANAIYLREPRAWLASVRAAPDPRAQALRGVMACVIVGYFDRALELAALAESCGLWGAPRHEELKRVIARASRIWPRAADDAVRAGRRLVHRIGHLGSGDG